MSFTQEKALFDTGERQSLKTTPREILNKYLPKLPWILVCIVIALSIAWVKLRYTIPQYRAGGSMLVRTESKGLGGGDKLEDLLQNKQSVNIRNEIEVIRSSVLGKRVVKALNLQTQYRNIGKVKYFVLYKNAPFRLDILAQEDSSRSFSIPVKVIDSNTFATKDGGQQIVFGEKFSYQGNVVRLVLTGLSDPSKAESKDFMVSWMPEDNAVSLVNGSLMVQIVNGNTTILGMSVESLHPQMAADIVNQLMKEYNLSNIEEKNLTSINTLQFIDERLDTITAELSQVERALQKFAEQSGAIDLESQSQLYVENLTQSGNELIQQEVKINVINYLLNYLRNTANFDKLVPNMLGVEEASLLPLITAYNELQMELQQDMRSIPEGNRRIKEKKAALENLRQDIVENLSNVKGSYQIALNSIKKKNIDSEQMLLSLPGKGKQKAEIGRQQKILEELYQFLLTKKIETSISSASTISNSRVLEMAHASWTPVKPDKKATYFIAFFLGLVIPVAIIALKEFLNDKIESRAELEKLTSAPVIGEIGHVDTGETLVAKPGSRTYVSEQFRIIRTNLQFILNKIEKPVILVTSSFGGEGKSFASTNIGGVMAMAGKRTVILELDIRKPKVMAGLDLSMKKGITSYIVSKMDPNELTVAVPGVENLFVIPCGPLPPNPSEMLMDEKLDELIAWAKKQFDVVIIDSAPVGLVSDSLILSRFTDCTMYVVRQGYTFKKQTGLINDMYSGNKFNRLSLLLNDVAVKKGYGGYYGYGYGYGYGKKGGNDYFEMKPTTRKWWKSLFSKK